MFRFILVIVIFSSFIFSYEIYAQGKSNNASNNNKNSSASANKSNKQSSNQLSLSVKGTKDVLNKAQSPNISSQLKSLNAAKANLSALINASSKSKVGKIAIYKERALATIQAESDRDVASDESQTLYSDWQKSLQQYEELLKNYDGRSPEEILADIANLDSSLDTYESDLEKLELEKLQYNSYVEDVNKLALTVNTTADAYDDSVENLNELSNIYDETLQKEEDFLISELNAGDLSDDGIKQLRNLLDLWALLNFLET